MTCSTGGDVGKAGGVHVHVAILNRFTANKRWSSRIEQEQEQVHVQLQVIKDKGKGKDYNKSKSKGKSKGKGKCKVKRYT